MTTKLVKMVKAVTTLEMVLIVKAAKAVEMLAQGFAKS